MASMIDIRAMDDLAKRLAELVPPGLDAAREDLQKTFRATLQAGLERLNLVTRDEFDVQRLVLLRTREKLDLLERELARIERQLAEPSPPP